VGNDIRRPELSNLGHWSYCQNKIEKIRHCMPILTSGSTVKVDDNLDIVCLRPTDSLKEIVVLPIDKWFVRGNIIGPISYRDAHVIESRNGHYIICVRCIST
jgi:hypothetical protein